MHSCIDRAEVRFAVAVETTLRVFRLNDVSRHHLSAFFSWRVVAVESLIGVRRYTDNSEGVVAVCFLLCFVRLTDPSLHTRSRSRSRLHSTLAGPPLGSFATCAISLSVVSFTTFRVQPDLL